MLPILMLAGLCALLAIGFGWALMERGRLPVGAMITRRMRFGQAIEAIAASQDREQAKIMVCG